MGGGADGFKASPDREGEGEARVVGAVREVERQAGGEGNGEVEMEFLGSLPMERLNWNDSQSTQIGTLACIEHPAAPSSAGSDQGQFCLFVWEGI